MINTYSDYYPYVSFRFHLYMCASFTSTRKILDYNSCHVHQVTVTDSSGIEI